MKNYNLILIFNKDKDHILMCLRTTNPYINKLNLIGGKREFKESSLHAAYRELFEETGVSKQNVVLSKLMTYYYFNDDLRIEIFIGHLNSSVKLIPEKHSLHWISTNENFNDQNKFAGEGNLTHILNIAGRFFTNSS